MNEEEKEKSILDTAPEPQSALVSDPMPVDSSAPPAVEAASCSSTSPPGVDEPSQEPAPDTTLKKVPDSAPVSPSKSVASAEEMDTDELRMQLRSTLSTTAKNGGLENAFRAGGFNEITAPRRNHYERTLTPPSVLAQSGAHNVTALREQAKDAFFKARFDGSLGDSLTRALQNAADSDAEEDPGTRRRRRREQMRDSKPRTRKDGSLHGQLHSVRDANN